MKKMGKYCKAYPVSRFREFNGWKENLAALRKDNDASRQLTNDDCFYLQENLVVTDGIFLDENVIFESDSAEWTHFCQITLQFELPDFVKAATEKPTDL
jgi:hypothetical protein